MPKETYTGTECSAAALLDEAVGEVMLMMLQLACEPGDLGETLISPISAEVTFAGAMQGSCVVRLATGCAAWLTTLLVGDPSEPHVELVRDTVGELCNMIAGGYKNRLCALLAGSTLSVPRIDLVEQRYCDGAVILVDRVYSLSGGDLLVSLALRVSSEFLGGLEDAH